MNEPSLAFQTSLRGALLASDLITFLVTPDNIRAGSTRPEKFPTIILANPQTINLGRTSGGWYLTRVILDVHIWAIEDGADLAREIGGLTSVALWDAPNPTDLQIIEYSRPSFRYMRDPDPDRAYCHAIGTVEGVVQWTV